MAWKAGGKKDLPLADSEREWDGDEAEDAIFEWAGWPEEKDGERARDGFFAYDDADPTLKKSYKLPFATVVDGRLKAVLRGIYAVASVLEGGRGGVDLPDEVLEDIRGTVETYYEQMGEEPPW